MLCAVASVGEVSNVNRPCCLQGGRRCAGSSALQLFEDPNHPPDEEFGCCALMKGPAGTRFAGEALVRLDIGQCAAVSCLQMHSGSLQTGLLHLRVCSSACMSAALQHSTALALKCHLVTSGQSCMSDQRALMC